MTITEFLLARIREDELLAMSAGGVRYEARLLERNNHSAPQAAHIARHSPDRVLLDCDARRGLVSICTDTIAHDTEGYLRDYAEQVLDFLAAPYAEHPDWQGAWRAMF